jgi:hypothetical protein
MKEYIVPASFGIWLLFRPLTGRSGSGSRRGALIECERPNGEERPDKADRTRAAPMEGVGRTTRMDSEGAICVCSASP